MVLTAAQAARLLCCSERTVRDLCRRNLIPHTRIGRRYRISLAALIWYVHSHGLRPIQMGVLSSWPALAPALPPAGEGGKCP